MAAGWFAAGCSSSKKVDVGTSCELNSDCNSPLSCSFGKCHDTCKETRDCPLGASCVKLSTGSVCQLPADAYCTGLCDENLVCAADQRCRAGCQTAAECLTGQSCVASGTSATSVCADSTDVDVTGQLQQKGVVGAACVLDTDCNSLLSCVMNECHYLCQNTNVCPTGQSCVKTATSAVCQLPAEAACDSTTPCSGGLTCAVDYRCRATCKSASDCTTGQSCAGGVCADPSDLNSSGQLTPRSPPTKPDSGADAQESDGGGKDTNLGTGGAVDTGGSPDTGGGIVADVAGPDNRLDAPVDQSVTKMPDAGTDVAPDATPTSTQTVALFHFDGTEGSTNLVDSSGTGKIATITGNPIISTAQSKFGGASLYINGTSSVRTNYVVSSGGADFVMDGDFTLDFWIFPISYPNTWGTLVLLGDCDQNQPNGPSWNSGGSGWHFNPYYPASSIQAPAPSTWHHVAVTRSGLTYRAFVDGAQVYTNTSSTFSFTDGRLWVTGCGSAGDNGDLKGYIDELRVVKGVAVWTSNFTPPTAPYTASSVLPVDAGTPDLPPAAPDASGDVRDGAASDAPSVPCGTSVCTGGGCCVANSCVANGDTCSTGGICIAGSCASTASLSASPLSLDFGSVTTGQSSSAQSFAITNTGQQTSGAITVTSDNSDFVVQTGGAFDCVSGKTTLAPGTACTVHVVFSPKLAVAVTGTVTVSATPGGSAGVSVSGTSACSADYLNDGTGTCMPLAGVVWTRISSPQGNFVSVGSSSDGSKLVVASGYIYTSWDSGATWTQRSTTSQNWTSVASSADGTKLVAAVSNGYIYTSVDSGVTWTQRGTQPGWQCVASSSDGAKLVAGSYGYAYTSADSGATWTQQGSTSQAWSSVASSADGTKLVAVAFNGYIFTSGDSGVTWTQRGTSSSWNSVASSADGTKLVAVAESGYIYRSVDSGVTWTQIGPQQYWLSVASSSDGTRLVAGTNQYLYTSWDSGANWKQRGTSDLWYSVASSADGTKLVAVAGGVAGHIYTSTGPLP